MARLDKMQYSAVYSSQEHAYQAQKKKKPKRLKGKIWKTTCQANTK